MAHVKILFQIGLLRCLTDTWLRNVRSNTGTNQSKENLAALPFEFVLISGQPLIEELRR